MQKTVTNFFLHHFDDEHLLMHSEGMSSMVPFTRTEYLHEVDITLSLLFKYDPQGWLIDFTKHVRKYSSDEIARIADIWVPVLQETHLKKVAYVVKSDSFSTEYANNLLNETKQPQNSLPIHFRWFHDWDEAMFWLL
ncbi:hypothetical protein V6R21_03395 [Limibacter armeniacum]|uniref:hypothetical protein n=1 Tax=Limibacter armeniacum TaxID=466084 RepID=UPI002FE5E4A2